MKRTEFNKLMDSRWLDIQDLNKRKGKDYAGDDDALLNFKQEATALGLTPEQVWGVYASKHFHAIQSYCKNGQVESEPIEERIKDIIVYSFLLMGLVEEKKKPEKKKAAKGKDTVVAGFQHVI